MISGQFDAVIPMLCVTLAGLVVLLAEAFRGKDERMPIGGLDTQSKRIAGAWCSRVTPAERREEAAQRGWMVVK